MNNTQNNPRKIPFLRYYESLMTKQGNRMNKRAASAFRDKVIKECGIAPRTFYAWLKYPETVRKSDQKIIVKLAKTDIDFVKCSARSGK